MGYNMKTWTNESTVTANDLNHMEDGLANVGKQVDAGQVEEINNRIDKQKTENRTAYVKVLDGIATAERKYNQSYRIEYVQVSGKSGPHDDWKHYDFDIRYNQKGKFFEVTESTKEIKILEDGVYMVMVNTLDMVSDIWNIEIEGKWTSSSGDVTDITGVSFWPTRATGDNQHGGYGSKTRAVYASAGTVISGYRLMGVNGNGIDFAYIKMMIIRIG
jgi:hypothetical protein